MSYLNKTHRWNWGALFDQSPYVVGSFAQGLTQVNGQVVIAQQELRQTQINRAATGMIQYPFSRSHRVEVTGGFRQISFDQELRTRMGAQGSDRAIARYRVGRLVDDVDELYRELLDEAGVALPRAA